MASFCHSGKPPSRAQSQTVDITDKWTDSLMPWLGDQIEQVAHTAGEAELGRQESYCGSHPERLTRCAPPRSAMHATERGMTASVSPVAGVRTWLRTSKQVPVPGGRGALGGVLSLALAGSYRPLPVPVLYPPEGG